MSQGFSAIEKLPHSEIYAASSGRHNRCPICFLSPLAPPHRHLKIYWLFVCMCAAGARSVCETCSITEFARNYFVNKTELTIYGHIKSTEQRTIIQQDDDRYTGRWWVGCYIWYSDEGPGRASAPPRPILAVPNVTAHPSTANVPASYHSMWQYNCL